MSPASDLSFRPAVLDDAQFAADCYTAAWPDEPSDPVVQRHGWEVQAVSGHPYREYIVMRGSEPLGLAGWRHPPFEAEGKRYGRVEVAFKEGVEDAELLAACITRMEDEVRADGADAYGETLRENEGWRLAVFLSLGYKYDRLGRWWGLDLVANRERLTGMAALARERAAAGGLTIAPLGARIDDAEFISKMWVVSNASELDVPTTVPHVPWPLEAFAAGLRSPSTPPDRLWVATEGQEVLGMSWLSYPPVRGNVWTDWTCVARAARGRGVARALKFETVMQAIELGIPEVRTENDAENAPILHLNEEMGYHTIPGAVTYLKDAD